MARRWRLAGEIPGADEPRWLDEQLRAPRPGRHAVLSHAAGPCRTLEPTVRSPGNARGGRMHASDRLIEPFPSVPLAGLVEPPGILLGVLIRDDVVPVALVATITPGWNLPGRQ